MAMLSKMFILRWKKVPRGVDLSPNMTDNQLTKDHGDDNELEVKILGHNNVRIIFSKKLHIYMELICHHKKISISL